jgi:hypothetical protein
MFLSSFACTACVVDTMAIAVPVVLAVDLVFQACLLWIYVLLNGLQVPTTGLLFGPPGTGKSVAARALASKLSCIATATARQVFRLLHVCVKRLYSPHTRLPAAGHAHPRRGIVLPSDGVVFVLVLLFTVLIMPRRQQKYAIYLPVASGDLLVKWAGESERHVRSPCCD